MRMIYSHHDDDGIDRHEFNDLILKPLSDTCPDLIADLPMMIIKGPFFNFQKSASTKILFFHVSVLIFGL